MMVAYTAALVIILIISGLLVLWCHYDDGVVGKLALIGCFFGAGVPLWEIISGTQLHVFTTTVLLTCGMALFLVRHLYRFVRWRCGPTCDWRQLGR